MPAGQDEAAIAVLLPAVYSCNKSHQACGILGNPEAFEHPERLHTKPTNTTPLLAPPPRPPPAPPLLSLETNQHSSGGKNLSP